VAALTIVQMLRDTAQLIAQVTPSGRADVLGWSMGSYVAQELAINAPRRVIRLILAAGDCGGPATIPPTKRATRILLDPQATQTQRLSILFPPDQMAAGAAWQAAIGEAFAVNHDQPAETFVVSPTTEAAQDVAPDRVGSARAKARVRGCRASRSRHSSASG
jgi:pimeloyl-ACP methyl ester carboxylesterase